MAIILSVSIDSKQKEFIDEMGLSASALLQRSINELMQNSGATREQLKALHTNIGFLQNTIKKQGTFIDKHGLMQEYLQVEDV